MEYRGVDDSSLPSAFSGERRQEIIVEGKEWREQRGRSVAVED